ncbi:hypothetical protein VP1G_02876 [Cytospora mali]|uniref:Steroid 5-alpha reductase C-terminal domain-containing protein n=1 Tax=Cytospora mali TaxID=578113 RepID=A0A194UUY6_CYTMA|nr:hypothetical protein VP1G_02876 [Valsa mali var. pyri (nom. inval.)]
MMVLPVLQSFPDCVDWSKTVDPYLPQLYELPSKLLNITQPDQGPLDLYLKTNPFISGLALSIFFGAIFFVVSEINKNYSQVDRCWSILPTFYIAHFDLWARLSGVPSQRLDLILFFSTLWSARLTFNYWRKGGYEIGSEDYRWEIVRHNVPAWAFLILNITFIAFIQSVLLFSLAAPVYPILLSTQFQPTLAWYDFAFLAAELGLLTTEYFADEQQWEYQNAKKEYQKTAKVARGFAADDLDRGFNTTGLWAWSRHPNFACEQSIWLTLGYWATVTSESPLSWTLIPGFSLVALFQGSTWLTEKITSGKYPEYKEYQRQVGMFAPNVLNLGPYQPPASSVAEAKVKEPKVKEANVIEAKLDEATATGTQDTGANEVTKKKRKGKTLRI